MKKIIALAGAGALLLSVAMPVLAHGRRVKVENEVVTKIKNVDVYADAISGQNEMETKAKNGGTAKINGDMHVDESVADASFKVETKNCTKIECACRKRVKVENDVTTKVKDITVYAYATSGQNEMEAKAKSDGTAIINGGMHVEKSDAVASFEVVTANVTRLVD